MAVGRTNTHSRSGRCRSKSQSFHGKWQVCRSNKPSPSVALSNRRSLTTSAVSVVPKKKVRFSNENTTHLIPPLDDIRFFDLHYNKGDYALFKSSAREEFCLYRQLYSSLSHRQILTIIYQPNGEDHKLYNECAASNLQSRNSNHFISLSPIKSLCSSLARTMMALLPSGPLALASRKTGAVAVSCMCWWLFRSSKFLLPRI